MKEINILIYNFIKAKVIIILSLKDVPSKILNIIRKFQDI